MKQPSMQATIQEAAAELGGLLTSAQQIGASLDPLGQALMRCWQAGGKLLTAGNGGSAAEAMHLAEELVVRYRQNRRALAAIALCDPTVLTCAGNDFGYESVFARQIEALGRPDDVLLVFSTSGRSANLLRAVEQARAGGLVTAAWLGGDGGALRGVCDHELIVPATTTARVQEMHQLFMHCLCEWVEQQVTD